MQTDEQCTANDLQACLVQCPRRRSEYATRTGSTAVKVHSSRVGRKSVSQDGRDNMSSISVALLAMIDLLNKFWYQTDILRTNLSRNLATAQFIVLVRKTYCDVIFTRTYTYYLFCPFVSLSFFSVAVLWTVCSYIVYSFRSYIPCKPVSLPAWHGVVFDENSNVIDLMNHNLNTNDIYNGYNDNNEIISYIPFGIFRDFLCV